MSVWASSFLAGVGICWASHRPMVAHTCRQECTQEVTSFLIRLSYMSEKGYPGFIVGCDMSGKFVLLAPLSARAECHAALYLQCTETFDKSVSMMATPCIQTLAKSQEAQPCGQHPWGPTIHQLERCTEGFKKSRSLGSRPGQGAWWQ